ncbi:MAG: hypothetical protein AAGA30_09315 [Planctomycetota bacterium]
MAKAAQAFDETTNRNILHRQPQLVREVGHRHDLPWVKIREGEMPPMMFQIRFCNGRLSSYAFSDIREVHCRDAGQVQVMLFAMRKIVITFEGRNLTELATAFCNATIRSVDESDPRSDTRPEKAPEIFNISIDPIAESD